MRIVIALALLVGCRSTPASRDAAREPTCVDVGRILRGNVESVAASQFKQKMITRVCERDEWSQAAITCVVREHQIYVCRSQLSDEQRDHYSKKLCGYQDTFPDEIQDVDSCRGSRRVARLYARLGGYDALAVIVNEWIMNIAVDPRINQMFANADMMQLRQQLIDQLCETSGGPCTYDGRDMKRAHAGMQIAPEHFEAFIEDLEHALETHHVAEREQDELVGLLREMKRDIIRR